MDYRGRKRGWTTGVGSVILLYSTDKSGWRDIEIKFKVLIYGSKCVKCDELGEISFYNSEINIVGENFAKFFAFHEFGFNDVSVSKKKGLRGSRQKHRKTHCEACSAGACLLK